MGEEVTEILRTQQVRVVTSVLLPHPSPKLGQQRWDFQLYLP